MTPEEQKAAFDAATQKALAGSYTNVVFRWAMLCLLLWLLLHEPSVALARFLDAQSDMYGAVKGRVEAGAVVTVTIR